MEAEETKPETETLPALKQAGITKEKLELLKADYENLVVTEANLKEANEARLTLYRPRIDIQNAEKDNNDILNKLKKDNKAKAESLIAIIEPIEKRIEADIKKIKDVIAQREAKKAADEQKRKDSHNKRISIIKDNTGKLAAINTQDGLEATLAQVNEMCAVGFDPDFKESADEAKKLFDLAYTQRVEFLQMKAQQQEDKVKATDGWVRLLLRDNPVSHLQVEIYSLPLWEDINQLAHHVFFKRVDQGVKTDENVVILQLANRQITFTKSIAAHETGAEYAVCAPSGDHHPHEIAEAPDSPEEVADFEKEAHPEFDKENINHRIDSLPKSTVNAPPSVVRPGATVTKEYEEWSYNGYKFGIATGLPEKSKEAARHALMEIVDGIEI